MQSAELILECAKNYNAHTKTIECGKERRVVVLLSTKTVAMAFNIPSHEGEVCITQEHAQEHYSNQGDACVKRMNEERMAQPWQHYSNILGLGKLTISDFMWEIGDLIMMLNQVMGEP